MKDAITILKKLNMVCHHCQMMINADEDELVKKDSDVI